MSGKEVVHRYLEDHPHTLGPRLVQGAVLLLIVSNVCALVLGTIPVGPPGDRRSIEDVYASAFSAFEWVSVVVFTVEYLLRLWSVTVDLRYARPIAGRLRYAITPLALIDLAAVLPFYLQVQGTLALRSLRVFRAARIFKLGRYSRALQSLGQAFVTKRAELCVTVLAIGVLLVVTATFMYYAERDAQPEAFSSIPAAMWWGIVTLTTVGYGDIAPVTTLGKLAGALTALFGIGIVALPAGILSSAFVHQVSRPETRKCPHCGKDV